MKDVTSQFDKPFIIYVTHSIQDVMNSHKVLRMPEIERKILSDQRLPYTFAYDKITAMELSNGRLNPDTDWVIQAPDGSLIYSYFQLVEYISVNGLKLC